MTDAPQSSGRRRARWIAITVAIVAALNFGLVVLDSIYGAPSGTPSSAFATIPRGVAAYAQLLGATGFRVNALRTPIAEAPMNPGDTLLVLEPESITSADLDAMQQFVRGGGRLVAGGPGMNEQLDHLLDDPPEFSPEATGEIRATGSAAELGDVGEITADGTGSWSDPGAADQLDDTGFERLLVMATLGDGQVWLLADVSPLQNRLLDEADNAALGLVLAGAPGQTVHFAESIHGYSNATGLGAIPPRWRWSLGLLSIAGLVWLFACSRRLGPPEPLGHLLAPHRAAYIHALATTLARTRRPAAAVQPVREAARKALIRRAGLGNDARTEELKRAAEAFGLTAAEIRAIVDGREDTDPVAVGHALARLTSKTPIGGRNGE